MINALSKKGRGSKLILESELPEVAVTTQRRSRRRGAAPEPLWPPLREPLSVSVRSPAVRRQGRRGRPLSLVVPGTSPWSPGRRRRVPGSVPWWRLSPVPVARRRRSSALVSPVRRSLSHSSWDRRTSRRELSPVIFSLSLIGRRGRASTLISVSLVGRSPFSRWRASVIITSPWWRSSSSSNSSTAPSTASTVVVGNLHSESLPCVVLAVHFLQQKKCKISQ